MSQYKEHKRTLLLLIILVASYLTNYVLNAYISQLLGVEAYGDFSVLFRMILIGVPLFLVGVDGTVLRYLPKIIGNKEEADKFIHWIRRIVITSMIFTFSLALFFTLVIWKTDRPSYIGDHYLLIVALFLLPLASINALLNKLMKCFGQFYTSTIIFQLGQYALPILLLFLTTLIFEEMHFYKVIIIYVISYTLVLVMQGYVLLIKKPFEHLSNKIKIRNKEWTNASIGFMFTSFSFTLLISIDLLLLSLITKDSIQVAHFNAILIISSFQIIIPIASAIVFNPKASTYLKESKPQKLQQLVSSTFVFNLLAGLVMPVIICAYSKELLATFGNSYSQLSPLLIAASLATYVTTSMTNTGAVLLFSSHYHLMLKINVFSILLATVLCIILIPFYGVTGAVISYVGVAFLSNVIRITFSKRLLKIKPFIIF